MSFKIFTFNADLTSFMIAVLSASMRILAIADNKDLAASGSVGSPETLLLLLLLLFSSVLSSERIVLQALFVVSHDSYISSMEMRFEIKRFFGELL